MRKRQFSWFKLLLVAVISVLFLGTGAVLYQAGIYMEYMDSFSGAVQRGDQTASKDSLTDLKFFKDRMEYFYLSWLEGYLSPRLNHGLDETDYRSAVQYVNNDKNSLLRDLEAHEDFWGYFLKANANFREAQEMMANALTLQDPLMQGEQKHVADKLAEAQAELYAAAVKSAPNEMMKSQASWNYDLVTDPKARQRALMPNPGKIKVKLGMPGHGPQNPGGRGEDDKGDPDKKTKDLDQGERGRAKPGDKSRKVG